MRRLPFLGTWLFEHGLPPGGRPNLPPTSWRPFGEWQMTPWDVEILLRFENAGCNWDFRLKHLNRLRRRQGAEVGDEVVRTSPKIQSTGNQEPVAIAKPGKSSPWFFLPLGGLRGRAVSLFGLVPSVSLSPWSQSTAIREGPIGPKVARGSGMMIARSRAQDCVQDRWAAGWGGAHPPLGGGEEQTAAVAPPPIDPALPGLEAIAEIGGTRPVDAVSGPPTGGRLFKMLRRSID